MSEIRVGSWNELNDRLHEGSYRQEIGRDRSTHVFRGVSDHRYSMVTSLMRLRGDYAALEPHLLRNFRKYAHRTAAPRDSIWNWLAVAQHHGLPTRLLDWTFSPLVAMHFATAQLDLYDRDGVIWSVDFVRAHQLLPQRLRSHLDEEGSDVFTVEMLDRAAPRLADLAPGEAEEDLLLFFEPPSLDERIVNQFALFSVTSRPTTALETWLGGRAELYRKIVIPGELKWQIRDKLDQANVTERVLFPGLEGLSRWLRRYYTPRSPDGEPPPPPDERDAARDPGRDVP